MQGWWDKCKEMQYSLRNPCNLVEAFGITFKAMGVPAMGAHTLVQKIWGHTLFSKTLRTCKNLGALQRADNQYLLNAVIII